MADAPLLKTALIYDFDGTLARGNMQEVSFIPSVGMGIGDFWGYALLAEGAAEVMVEVGLWPWDAAAPAILVEEAGGRVTDFAGERRLDTRTFLATNGAPHDEVLRLLVDPPS